MTHRGVQADLHPVIGNIQCRNVELISPEHAGVRQFLKITYKTKQIGLYYGFILV